VAGESRAGATPAALPGWLGPALVAAVFAALCAWSFGKWTDVQIDFGTELYVAWQLLEGKLLYRDIAYRNGPLSPYVNAGLFALFGISLRTLVLFNLLVLAGITAGLYRFFQRPFGRLAAVCVTTTFLCVFAFSQYVWVANYNYVTPYQHAQTHGLALSLLLVALLTGAPGSLRPGRLVAAGLCLGLVFLTKAELFVPAATAVVAALCLRAVAVGDQRGMARAALVLLAAATVPVALAAVALALASGSEAAAGILGNWRYLGSDLMADPFYGWVTGLATWRAGAAAAGGAAAAMAGAAAAVLAADRLAGARGPAVAPAAAVCTAGALLWAGDAVPWNAVPRGLPVVACAAAVGLAWRAARRRGSDAALGDAALAVWAVWALALLSKVLFHARIPHYGFVLAMPATLLLVVAAVGWLPAWARALGGSGVVARWLAVALLLPWVAFWLRLSNTWYAAKDLPVGEGGDRIWVASPPASLRGARIAETLAAVDELSPPGESLLVLPEGSIVNYWLRRTNPSRYHLFLPAELAAYGSDAVLADVRAHPPDLVVLLTRRHREFGVGPFGSDPRFGRDLLAFVRANYVPVAAIGDPPFAGRGFGAEVLRRRAPPPRDQYQ
jgi:hypothetical protein